MIPARLGLFSCLALFPYLLAFSAPGQEKAPSSKETLKLVEEYVALDWKTPAGMKREDEILARLALVPPLKSKDVKRRRPFRALRGH